MNRASLPAGMRFPLCWCGSDIVYAGIMPLAHAEVKRMETRKKPEYVTRIEKLMAELGLSQLDLSRQTGIEQSMISKYVSGKRVPGRLSALFFAGLCRDIESRVYWLRLAGIDSAQRELIRTACGGGERQEAYEERLTREFLSFWYAPQGVVMEGIRDLLKRTVFDGIDKLKPET